MDRPDGGPGVPAPETSNVQLAENSGNASAIRSANAHDAASDARQGLSSSQHNPRISTTPPTSPRIPRPHTVPSVGQVTGSSHSVANIAPVPLAEKAEDRDVLPGFNSSGLRRDGGFPIHNINNPLPPLPQARLIENDRRRPRTLDRQNSATARRSTLDWIVPVEPEKPIRKKTVGERIQPTLDIAKSERDKYATKARWTGLALNIAIGLQVILGSLTTGLSAVATTGRQTAIQTTILGGLATLVASYLARARGSNEPELSITRVKDLEHFIREVEAFQLDCGHIDGNDCDPDLTRFRQQFEELLGNASGERKLAPPV